MGEFRDYWVAIDDAFVLISMAISEQTHTIGKKSNHVVEHASGFKKLMTEKGVKQLTKDSKKVAKLIA